MASERAGTKQFTASVLVENQGAFLVLYHQKLGFWLYPGGHVEPDEEPQDAALRELEEEAAISARLLSCGAAPHLPIQIEGETTAELPVPLSVLCERIPDKDGGHHWHIDMIYVARATDDQRALFVDRVDAKWVTSDEAERLDCPRELPPC